MCVDRKQPCSRILFTLSSLPSHSSYSSSFSILSLWWPISGNFQHENLFFIFQTPARWFNYQRKPVLPPAKGVSTRYPNSISPSHYSMDQSHIQYGPATLQYRPVVEVLQYGSVTLQYGPVTLQYGPANKNLAIWASLTILLRYHPCSTLSIYYYTGLRVALAAEHIFFVHFSRRPPIGEAYVCYCYVGAE